MESFQWRRAFKLRSSHPPSSPSTRVVPRICMRDVYTMYLCACARPVLVGFVLVDYVLVGAGRVDPIVL